MSRKYRQSGYQDGDSSRDRDSRRGSSSSPRNQNLTKEERIQQRSLRRATAREANEVVRCPSCGRNILRSQEITKTSECPHCPQALHCCRTCRFFDSAARWQCRASIEAPVPNKGSANDCDQYRPRLVLDHTGRRTQKNRPSDPKSAFESLFKN